MAMNWDQVSKRKDFQKCNIDDVEKYCRDNGKEDWFIKTCEELVEIKNSKPTIPWLPLKERFMIEVFGIAPANKDKPLSIYERMMKMKEGK